MYIIGRAKSSPNLAPMFSAKSKVLKSIIIQVSFQNLSIAPDLKQIPDIETCRHQFVLALKCNHFALKRVMSSTFQQRPVTWRKPPPSLPIHNVQALHDFSLFVPCPAKFPSTKKDNPTITTSSFPLLASNHRHLLWCANLSFFDRASETTSSDERANENEKKMCKRCYATSPT